MSLLPADFIHRDCKQICAIILTLPRLQTNLRNYLDTTLRVDKEVIPKQYRSIAKAKNNAQKGEMLFWAFFLLL